MRLDGRLLRRASSALGEPEAPAAWLRADELTEDEQVEVTQASLSTAVRGEAGLASQALTVGKRPRFGEFGRIASITATLVGTQAATSLLGFAYWTIAARRFPVAAMGVAGAATAAMQMLGSVGMLGFGTLLIAQLAAVAQSRRRLLLRTTVALVAVVSLILGIVFALGVGALPVGGLRSVGSSPFSVVLFAVGVSVTGVTLVLDQAGLAIGSGMLQLERNIAASTTKIFALLLLSYAGHRGGMAIYLSWTVGTILSMGFVVWRTRGGRRLQEGRKWFEPSTLRGYGRAAASHHLLNLSIQAPALLLSPLVAIEVSTTAAGYFSTVILVAGFVFVLPFAISVGLFAATAGNESTVVDRMRFTLPVSIVASLSADAVIYVAAPYVLGVFGSTYAAHGVLFLRLLVLAGLPFVVKDHYVAVRRVQGRTGPAARLMLATAVLEVAAAAVGADIAGTTGLCVAWVCALMLEGSAFAVPLWRTYRGRHGIGAAPPKTPDVALAPTMASFEAVPLVDAAPVVAAAPVERRRRKHAGVAGPMFFVMCAGLFVGGLAAVAGRQGRTPAEVDALFWTSLVLMFVPAAGAVLSPRTSSRQRRFAVVALGLVLQVSRFMLYPLSAVFHDELAHTATLISIEHTHHLFGANPLLPVSSYYPGLEIATYSIHALLGVPDRLAMAVVLVTARLVMTLALLAIFERLGRSERFACTAVLLYACNEQYLFFNSQFSYQTLALPLALLVIYLLLRNAPSYILGARLTLTCTADCHGARCDALSNDIDGSALRPVRWRAALLPLSAMAATVITHHLTAMLLAGTLGAWWLLGLRRERGTGFSRVLFSAFVGASVLTAAWTAVPGNPVIGYLQQIGQTAAASTGAFLSGKRAPHALFADPSGYHAPLWEVGISIVSDLLVFVVLVLAVLHLWRRRHRLARPLAVLLALAACCYPIVPAGHFASATSEVTDRSSSFLFIGVAFVTAWWLLDRTRSARRSRTAVTCALVGVVFVGQVILGSGPQWAQTPGTFLVSADSRSVDAYNLAAARWEASHIPRGTHVLADRVGSLLAGAVGNLYAVSHIADNVNASRVLLAPHFNGKDIRLIRQLDIHYVIVDVRDAQGLPRMGIYYESGEYQQNRTKPVSRAALTKLATVPGVQRVYSNGPISIYNVTKFDARS